jgi:acyl-coenzyme A thioesterase PaaI-like protein
MAATLEAAVDGLDRDDLDLVSATTTFARPVACGDVAADVDVISSSRSGATVHVALANTAAVPPAPGVVTTAAFARRGGDWPRLTTAVRPDVLARAPLPSDPRMGSVDDGYPTELPFFRSTDWRRASTRGAKPRLAACAWFRFAHAMVSRGEQWPAALTAIPADALGFSIVSDVSPPGAIVYSLSLQISLHCFAPARGEWLGIESRCLHASEGTATGVATLWNDDGQPVATVTQTALLRVMGSAPA